MASLTSTSGGKIPVDSTVTAQRHTSQHSHEAASASMPLSLTFPYIPLQPARSSQPERQQPLPAESTNRFNPKAKSQIPLHSECMDAEGGERHSQPHVLASSHKPCGDSGERGTYRCNGSVLLPGAQGFSAPHVGKLLC